MDTGRVKYSVRRFTLVELLVAMAVMVMLTLIAIPMFRGMTRLNKVDAMASNVKLALEQTRSLAIKERRPVALVFCSGRKEGADNANRFCNGGWRITRVRKSGEKYIFDDETGGADKNKRFVSLDSWHNAPDGAMLVKISAAKEDLSDGVTVSDKSMAVQMEGFSSSLKQIDFFYTADNSGGENDEEDGYSEPSAIGERELFVGDEDETDSANPAFRGIVFNSGGRALFGDSEPELYLIFAECGADSNAYDAVIEDSDDQGKYHNIRRIKIERLTGRVSFVKED